MNEVRLKGTLKFAPRAFSAGVGVVVQPEGETSGVDVTAWTSDAPEAVAALAKASEGAKVSILGKISRGKDKHLAKADGTLGYVWTLKVSAVKVRVEAAPVRAPEPPPSASDDVPF